ncbi:hypothetical protein OIU76_026667 [Salix suchowensis]|nr:hypothetical protein OIU78_023798 [Salix suchowensis]KAJ6372227.1 hypothetical protein OIU76_026667 [Salix suchowensis]
MDYIIHAKESSTVRRKKNLIKRKTYRQQHKKTVDSPNKSKIISMYKLQKMFLSGSLCRLTAMTVEP